VVNKLDWGSVIDIFIIRFFKHATWWILDSTWSGNAKEPSRSALRRFESWLAWEVDSPVTPIDA